MNMHVGGAGAGKFKVGDRVRYTTYEPAYRAAWTEDVMTIIDIGSGGDNRNVYLDYGDGYFQTARQDDIDLVANDAPHRIEEGKCYQTSDGRKVGPMQACGWDPVVFTSPGTGGVWQEDGEPYYSWAAETDSPPLVSEYAGEYHKGCAAAEVDNLRDEYGPHWPGSFVIMSLPKHAFVARILRGQPWLEDRPNIHKTAAEAAMEAERLALEDPGEEFGVYELVFTQKFKRKFDYE
jgi:hypothetical protein